MSEAPVAPVIVKRKKVVEEEGHHGGAWKVAYADFVTAMMAFFLLMWLLNATTEKQRKGLADYFSPSIPISRVSAGGDGSFWGESVFAEDTLAFNEQGASDKYPTEMQRARGDVGVPREDARADSTGLGNRTGAEELLEELTARGGESMAQLLEMRHVVTRLTDAGLVIDIYERPDARLFAADGTSPTPLMSATLELVADTLGIVANDVSVGAHVPARPVVVADNPVWEVTTRRAHKVRGELEAGGLPAERIERVTGYADRVAVDDNPTALRNSRVEITVLRDDV